MIVFKISKPVNFGLTVQNHSMYTFFKVNSPVFIINEITQEVLVGSIISIRVFLVISIKTCIF